MAETERRSGALLGGQKKYDREYVDVGKAKQPVSRLLSEDLMGSLPTAEEIEAELAGKERRK